MFARFALSVVVASLDRGGLLEKCLQSLSPVVQTAVDPYEVIVVEQWPGVGRAARLIDLFPFVKYHSADWQGLSRARNVGVDLAQSDVVAFIDDDAVADRGWVEAMVEIFRSGGAAGIAMCGGKVTADYGGLRRPDWLSGTLERYLSCIDFGEVAGPIEKGRWIVGANFAVRRRDLLAAGGFDQNLGRRGRKNLLSNEESALVKAFGADRVLYNPAAKVRHLIPAARLEQSWFRKRVCWQAVSDMVSDGDYPLYRKEGRKAESDEHLAARTVSSLFADVGDAQALEDQLQALYDVVSSGLLDGILPFLAG